MRLVSSPCTKVCLIDPVSRLCAGCRRTLEEIGQWATMTEPQRLAVMAALPERHALAAATPDRGMDRCALRRG